MREKAIIIGAGQAGAQAAASMRQCGFDGEISILGAETAPPYQRPPLSKAYLKGELSDERLFLRPEDFYAKQEIQLRLGAEARYIDRDAQAVIMKNGEKFAYDKLLIATGAPPRRLSAPGADLAGVFYLRTLADSQALRSILTCKGRVLVVGAGYVGLEVAAVARHAGQEVTVIELADKVLARVASEPVSVFYQELHHDAGVELRLGSSLERFVGDDGKLIGAQLATGEIIDCAAALVGIGAVPAVNLAVEAGLKVANGIVVDEQGRTSEENIWAAGDCANFPSSRYQRRMRLESVPNAIEQAKVAGANMAGGKLVYNALPWFWSDQYDVKLQTVGLSEGYDEIVIRGNPKEKKFAAWYLKDGKVLAVDAVNDPASFAFSKKLIMEGASINPSKLADASLDLKELVDENRAKL